MTLHPLNSEKNPEIKNAFANELNPERAQTLRDQGFNVTQADATTHTSPMVQVVLANPPFGRVKDTDGKTKEFDVDGFKTKEIDHAIALQSLKGMESDGYTVLILAAKGHDAKTDLERRQAYAQDTGRSFYDVLYSGYDVTNHVTIDGSLYSRQGASFPVDVIVLRPQGTVGADEKRATPWAIVPRIFNNWQEIKDAFFQTWWPIQGNPQQAFEPTTAVTAVPILPHETKMTWEDYLDRMEARLRWMKETSDLKTPNQWYWRQWSERLGADVAEKQLEDHVHSFLFKVMLEEHGVEESMFPLHPLPTQEAKDSILELDLTGWLEHFLPTPGR